MTLLLTSGLTTAATGLGPRYVGVNIAGGEFKPGRIPGKRDKDYTYPRAKDFRPFLEMGMNAVRVPVRWERLQPTPFGALSTSEIAALDKSLRSLAPAKLIIIDLHNYGRYRGIKLTDVSGLADALPDVWRRLADHYAGAQQIAFGLMNEPHDIDAKAWRKIVDETVDAIRATGAKNVILVPGTAWTGAHSWTGANGAAFAGFRDRRGPFLYDMHQYLDADSSGTHAECTDRDAGPKRLSRATAWLIAERQQAFLGEFGVSPNPDCLAALDAMLGYMDRNSNAWAGWTYWAAGPWWGKYPLSIQPVPSGERPQTAVLWRHVPSR